MDIAAPLEVCETAQRADAAAANVMIQQRGGTQYLTFTAAGTTYAMSIVSTKEIIEFGSVTKIPLMPHFIRGVINLRGVVLPVIDLAARLGFPSARPGRRSCIVIVEMTHEDETFDLGVIVDGVNEVLELDQDDLEPPPRFGANIRSDFIEAMARIHGDFVIVMHLEQVLAIEEVAELARVSESSQLFVQH